MVFIPPEKLRGGVMLYSVPWGGSKRLYVAPWWALLVSCVCVYTRCVIRALRGVQRVVRCANSDSCGVSYVTTTVTLVWCTPPPRPWLCGVFRVSPWCLHRLLLCQ